MMLAFLDSIEELSTRGTISSNIRCLLKDFARTKEEPFFSTVVHVKQDGSRHVHHLEDIIVSKARQSLEKIYKDCSYERAKDASLNERVLNNMHQDSLVYGEVEYESFIHILRWIPVQRGGTFYDLGSGSGRAVFTARLMHDFEMCTGVELLPELHELANEVKSVYHETTTKLSFDAVSFHCQDILKYDWSDGAVVFVHSTCFEDDLLQPLFIKAKQLRPGSYFITFRSTGIPTSAFELVKEMRQEMSWGVSDVFVYRRR